MMSTRRSNDKAFEFLKTEDQENLLEWEANQDEIDRQWYDAEEDGNIRYGDEYVENDEEAKLRQKRI